MKYGTISQENNNFLIHLASLSFGKQECVQNVKQFYFHFLCFELDLFRVVILLKTPERNYHKFLWNKTEVNKCSFKMDWFKLTCPLASGNNEKKANIFLLKRDQSLKNFHNHFKNWWAFVISREWHFLAMFGYFLAI